MTYKVCLFSLLLMASFGSAEAAKKNMCDELEEKKFPSEQVAACRQDAKYGESDHYKEQQKKKELKALGDKAKAANEALKKDNIEMKTFSKEEIGKLTFGAPLIAFTEDEKFKEKRVSSSDELCGLLGYQKAVQSRVSSAHVINKTFHIKDEKPTIFEYNKEKFAVREYLEITCGKVISKEIKGTEKMLSELKEYVDRGDGEESDEPSDNAESDSVHNKPRTSAPTIRGYRSQYGDEEPAKKTGSK